MSTPSPAVVWASGTKGTWLRTADGGASWHHAAVPGAETLDFRDVEAFDERSAVLMSAGPGAASRIYRTEDGGTHWQLSLENPDPRGFFDAIAFRDRSHGLLLGDPVDGRFVLYRTDDGGKTWTRIPREDAPPAMPGEAAFAASGTCLAAGPDGRAWFGTGGGKVARVFRSADGGRTWRAASTPMAAGESPSAGIFSLVFLDSRHGVAVGGDYKVPGGPAMPVARTDDGGETWTLAAVRPPTDRFLSAVARVPGTSPPRLVATGTAGSGWSLDGGATWIAAEGPGQGFNALAFAGPDAGWAVGPGGAIVKVVPAPSKESSGSPPGRPVSSPR